MHAPYGILSSHGIILLQSRIKDSIPRGIGAVYVLSSDMGDPMRRIDVQEFRTQAPDVLTGNEAMTQSRDKETSITDLQAAIDAALAEGSLSRDEPGDLFDLRRPLS